jgi:hypothetical protein
MARWQDGKYAKWNILQARRSKGDGMMELGNVVAAPNIKPEDIMPYTKME